MNLNIQKTLKITDDVQLDAKMFENKKKKIKLNYSFK